MKKIISFFCGILLLSSCISLHRAERINGFKLTSGKVNQVDLTSYVLQYDGGDLNQFKNTYQYFFNPDDNFSIYELETTNLFGDDTFKVFSHFSEDYDKTLSIFDAIESVRESKKSEEQKNQEKPYKDRREKQQRKNNKIEYVYIQVMDKKGNDVLAEKSMRKDAVLQKLHQLRKQLNR